MHLKKTKKTPRMFRMIALMLSLMLMFFTMTGMALAEEGTDVSDAAPDSTLEIVETELEGTRTHRRTSCRDSRCRGNAGTHAGVGRTPIPPEPTDTPALEPIMSWTRNPDWLAQCAGNMITVRLIDKNNTGWVKSRLHSVMRMTLNALM